MSQLEELRRVGVRRIGSPKSGFRYVRRNGRRVSAEEAERIRALRLPPAWTDVFVNPSPLGKLQAVGKDKAGRWQYRYHPSFMKRRSEAKYRRLMRFAAALPRIRRAVDEHLRLPGLPREKVLACAVRVLSACFMRAGSREYAEKNGSFGVATLRRKHVSVRGDLVRFDYTGKAGKRQVRELRDRRVAGIVRQCLALPGRELLKFLADDGAVDVRRRHINLYLKEISGGPFTAKDFRTWAGTLICACELARHHAEALPGRTDRKKLVAAAVKATAAKLGNTPAVCRTSYIYPGVIDGFQSGKVVERYFENVEELAFRRGRGLHGSEKALLTLLRSRAA